MFKEYFLLIQIYQKNKTLTIQNLKLEIEIKEVVFKELKKV
jgi:hypothetical protein